MFDTDQIAEMKRKMLEEHQRDLEALERLQKYLPARPHLPSSRPLDATPEPANGSSAPRATLKESILAIIDEEPNINWTRRSLREMLDRSGFESNALDKDAAINQALRTLVKKDQIVIVAKGTGSALSVYRSAKVQGDADPHDEQLPFVEA